MDTKECQFCYSQIPQKAKKCRYCLEWEDKKDIEDRQPQIKESFDISLRSPASKKPFQLAIIEKIPLHYGVSILIIGVICFMAIQFSWYRLNEDRIYLLSFFVWTIQMMVSWSGLIWVNKIINENYASFIKISSKSQEAAKQKLIKYDKIIFNNTFSILTGITLGTIASFGDFVVGAPFYTLDAKIIFAVFEFINMFFAGAAIYSLFMFAIFIHRISSNPDHNSLHLDNNNVINNIGRIHLKISILAIVPLFLGVLAKFFGNWSWEFLIILWYGSFAVAIIIYIYWPMLNIHRLMRGDLEHQVVLIQKKIREKLIEINTNPSSRNFVKLNELKLLEKSISNENTWPFDAKSLSAAFFATIFPIVLIIVDKIWSI